MDEKSLIVLEFPRVLARLEALASFSASAELARALRPTSDLELALERQARTSEARRLRSEHPEAGIGAAHDVRQAAGLAARGGVLSMEEMLDLRATLQSARELARLFEKHAAEYPRLAAAAAALPPPPGLIEAISKVFSEKGELLDSASPRLKTARWDQDRPPRRRQTGTSGQRQRHCQHLAGSHHHRAQRRYVLPVKAETSTA